MLRVQYIPNLSCGDLHKSIYLTLLVVYGTYIFIIIPSLVV